MGSLDSYLPILLMIVLGIVFAVLSLIASKLLAPQRPTAAKEAPYECGIVPTHEPARRFPVRFYLVAMIFIIFDIEVIFLFPWAIIYGQLGRFGLIEILVFVVSVFIPFVYFVSNGALDWGPIRRVKPQPSEYMRTTTSTVRRVTPPTVLTATAEPAPTEPAAQAPAAAPAPSAAAARERRDPVPVPTGAAYGPKGA